VKHIKEAVIGVLNRVAASTSKRNDIETTENALAWRYRHYPIADPVPEMRGEALALLVANISGCCHVSRRKENGLFSREHSRSTTDRKSLGSDTSGRLWTTPGLTLRATKLTCAKASPAGNQT
jgi:hypothetical protein